MKRIAMLTLVLMTVAFALCVTEARAGEAKPCHVHFTVIPAVMPDGSDPGPALVEFRAELIRLAGGYTELGPSRGGKMHPEGIVHEENIAFVVGADRDLSGQIKTLTRRLFGEANVFILAWPGSATF
ncbi:hypothetical protein GKC30_00310 [Pseudodesulfovibrio sp. F-1]|uniref:DUF3574 domain-containing protein n=1 Tax=Pseudodesulfovibrio alkaliphilus TaxID=2661613 RepID=A0A7K1KJL0_9BACT|nr:hypothetical protein [Pseudodesulfovibrio alkaliphilus]MUM76072.1 hypothetical protein [Pseudodesulfovibrio alkaliphilus]